MRHGIEFPLPPSKDDDLAMEVYARFMGHLRKVLHRRGEIKVLASIQFTAMVLDYTDAHVAKMLVDLGLRVGRSGLPAEYLEFAHNSLMRSGWEVGGPSASLLALNDYWDEIGENKFAGVVREYDFTCGMRAIDLADA